MKDFVDKIFAAVTLFFVGAIVIGVLAHAGNFSEAAGTLFSGTNMLGSTLEGK